MYSSFENLKLDGIARVKLTSYMRFCTNYELWTMNYDWVEIVYI